MSIQINTKEFFQGEGFTLVTDVKDGDGDTVDVSGSTASLAVVRSLGDEASDALFTKADAKFSKNVDSKNYRVSVVLESDDTDFNGVAYAEFKFIITADTDERKGALKFIVKPSAT